MNKFDSQTGQSQSKNKFDSHTRQSQSKHFKTSATLGFIALPVIMLVTLWLTLGKGYSIEVTPDDAKPSASLNIVAGVGFFYKNKLYSFGDEVAVMATADGYITHTEQLHKHSQQNVTIVLKPKPGQLIAKTMPEVEQVKWYLDGKAVAESALYTAELEPGSYYLKAESVYYQSAERAFDIDKAQELNLQLELKPIKGQIRIQSQPQGATVTLNGDVVGKTPITLSRPGDRYFLQVNKTNYDLVDDQFEITNTQSSIKRDYRLKAKNAFVRFNLQPSGGTLLVNGKQITQSQLVPLSSQKTHLINYESPGYFSFKQELLLVPDEQKTVAIKLKREFGQVVLDSTPSSIVLVNGKPKGNTPLELKLPAVSHKVEFKKTGYRSVSQSIKPSSESAVVLKPKLLTEYQARRRDKQPTEAEKLGIKMVNFRPDEVIVGSKATEKGRRRNEFVKKVQFSRPIAVSRHEISENQFNAFVGSGKSGSALPVTNITWLQAAQYCNWLSLKDGLTPFYKLAGGRYQGIDEQSKGYRLPTEAEWEWLAKRAKRVVETKYVWGNFDRLPDRVGNVSDENARDGDRFFFIDYDDGYESKAPIGSFKPDRIGLYDLVGNVSEWVHDIYTNVPPDPNTVFKDPLGPQFGKEHLYKGGSFVTGRLKNLRASWRESLVDKAEHVGFRIARYL